MKREQLSLSSKRKQNEESSSNAVKSIVNKLREQEKLSKQQEEEEFKKKKEVISEKISARIEKTKETKEQRQTEQEPKPNLAPKEYTHIKLAKEYREKVELPALQQK